jgi:hypothetical protein
MDLSLRLLRQIVTRRRQLAVIPAANDDLGALLEKLARGFTTYSTAPAGDNGAATLDAKIHVDFLSQLPL